MTDNSDQSESQQSSTIPDSHLAAVGKAVSAWSDFELTVDRCIWKLMGVEQAIGACVTGQLTSVFHKLSALRSLLSLTGVPVEIRKKLKTFSGEMSAINEERNRVVHDTRFLKSDFNVARFSIVAKSNLKFGLETETIQDLQNFCDTVYSKQLELISLWKLIEIELLNWPPISQLPLPRIVLSDLD